MNCTRTGCGSVANCLPVITFAAEVMPAGPRGRAVLQLPVCTSHAVADPDLFLTEDAWRALTAQMRAAGMARPGRDTVALEFTPLS